MAEQEIEIRNAQAFEIEPNKKSKKIKYKDGREKIIVAKNEVDILDRYVKIDKYHYRDRYTKQIYEYKQHKYKTEMAQKRDRKERLEILDNNFNGGESEKFLTLTSSEDNTYEDTSKNASKCFRNLKAFNGNIEYFYVLEQGENENWHIHALIKDKTGKPLFIDNELLSKLWGQGYTYIESIDKNTRYKLFEYIAKIETKEHTPNGKKGYFKSRGIVKPEVERKPYGQAKKEALEKGCIHTKTSTKRISNKITKKTENIIQTEYYTPKEEK